MPELAYVNGVFGPPADAMVSIEDRGFQFGDGIYEVIVAYDGRLFLLEPHMRRLRRSAAGIGLDFDFDANPLAPIIADGLRRSGLDDALVYVQLTRGVAPRSDAIPEGLTPTVVMTFKPLPAVPEELRQRGARVMTTLDTRWRNCYIKTITRLPNLLAYNEALRRGYDDAVFVTQTGQVRECTSSNVFIAQGDRLVTPPRTESVLHGVTQEFLVDCAVAISLKTEERAFDVESLLAADEVFMSGTTVEVLAITAVDDKPIGTGLVGPISQRLYREFKRRSREGAASVE